MMQVDLVSGKSPPSGSWPVPLAGLSWGSRDRLALWGLLHKGNSNRVGSALLT